MKYVILVTLVGLGIHGVRHRFSHKYLNVAKYKLKKKLKKQKLVEWMHDNGIGA